MTTERFKPLFVLLFNFPALVLIMHFAIHIFTRILFNWSSYYAWNKSNGASCMGTNLLLHCSYFKRVFSSQKFNQIPIVYNNIFLNLNTLKPKNYTTTLLLSSEHARVALFCGWCWRTWPRSDTPSAPDSSAAHSHTLWTLWCPLEPSTWG